MIYAHSYKILETHKIYLREIHWSPAFLGKSQKEALQNRGKRRGLDLFVACWLEFPNNDVEFEKVLHHVWQAPKALKLT